jgi:AP-1 complex subunit beta-1
LVDKVGEYSEPEARASIAWIIGEHAEKITDCQKVFEEYFLQTFVEEPDSVKLQILTASVKLYLKLPDECEDMIQKILTTATE